MNENLTEHQREALTRYFWLMENHEELFSGRLRRPIVRAHEPLIKYAAENSIVLGVLAETDYVWFINDLVRSRDASGTLFNHPYLRLIAPPEQEKTSGVVALATVHSEENRAPEYIVLVEQERHATGTLELEVPRGFGNPGIPPESHVLYELEKESGYRGEQAERLGTTLTDSGTSDGSVSFFHVPVTDRTCQAPEPQEAISRVVLLTRDELWARITSGEIHDSFTLQALALYERSLLSKTSEAPMIRTLLAAIPAHI